MLRTAVLIAAKDLRQRIRDRSVILFAVVAPLGLAAIFSQLLAGTTEFRAVYVVADLDRGALAVTFREEVIGSLVDAGVVEVLAATDAADARTQVEAGDADAAFIIPAGFSAAIQAGQPTSIEVLGAADQGLATEIARALANQFADGVAAVELSVAVVGDLRGRALTPEEVGAVIVAAAGAQPAIALEDVATSLRQLSATTYFSASMAILFLFFAASASVLSLFEERRQGTLARLLAGPIRPQAILLGKTLGSLVTGSVALTVLVVATTLLLGASWGPPLGVALLIGAAVISSIGVTLLVTSVARTYDGASGANGAVAITLGILGGTFSPSAQAPEAMATLSLVTPHAWFLRGLGDMQGATGSIADALPAVAVLLAIGLVTGALGFARARRLVATR
jgi:ABC-2 type transport system permease protein